MKKIKKGTTCMWGGGTRRRKLRYIYSQGIEFYHILFYKRAPNRGLKHVLSDIGAHMSSQIIVKFHKIIDMAPLNIYALFSCDVSL